MRDFCFIFILSNFTIMKILTIGDIHGDAKWKAITHGSIENYNSWATACLHGAEPDSDYWNDCTFKKVDKIVFVGDYVDSFDATNVEILDNLKQIIEFKKILGDRVVLLLGNHDIQYICSNLHYSGYRAAMKHDLYYIFMENIKHFKAAYEYGDTLWTHAGVTEGWLKSMRKEMFNTVRTRKISDVAEEQSYTLANEIQFAWELNLNSFFANDALSGGVSLWAGPIWVRPKLLNEFAIADKHQVVGHTACTEPYWVECWRGEKLRKNFYTDCLYCTTDALLLTFENEKLVKEEII